MVVPFGSRIVALAAFVFLAVTPVVARDAVQSAIVRPVREVCVTPRLQLDQAIAHATKALGLVQDDRSTKYGLDAWQGVLPAGASRSNAVYHLMIAARAGETQARFIKAQAYGDSVKVLQALRVLKAIRFGAVEKDETTMPASLQAWSIKGRSADATIEIEFTSQNAALGSSVSEKTNAYTIQCVNKRP